MRSTVLIFFAFIISLHATAADLIFETALKTDQEFVKQHERWLKEKYLEQEAYFGVAPKEPVRIQILPVEKNADFKFCARTYVVKRIYAHSPESLASMPVEKRKGYEPLCFDRDYNDLKYTLVHEYVHILTLLKTKSDLPKWVWEGAAVALSGQLKNTKMGLLPKSKMAASKKLDFCANPISDLDSYIVGGAYLNYLERRQPGIVGKLISFYSENQLHDLKSFLSNFKEECSVKWGDITAAI